MEAANNMYYDKEYLKSMQKDEKDKFVKNFINELVSGMHDPKLIIKDACPMENYIYHLYDDGTITYTKGGWAYGDRSIFVIKPAVISVGFFKFPNKVLDNSYAILTASQCYSIRNLIVEMMA